MKEIGTIALDRMNNGAHFLFVSNILARAEADEKVSTKVAPQINLLKAAIGEEDAAMKLSQKSLLTDDIAAADKECDAFYSGYKQAVKGFLNLSNESVSKAAKVLNQHIIDYNINPQGQIDKQIGLLINFIADLEGKYQSEVNTLGLTPFVTALKEVNERIRTLKNSRTEERMNITVGAMKAARKAVDNAYRTLVKWVNALALIEGETEYADFIDYVNTEIIHYKREVIGQPTTQNPSEGEKPGDLGDGETSEPETPEESGGEEEEGGGEERPGGL